MLGTNAWTTSGAISISMRKLSPNRILDDATMEQIGDFLVIEWRGDRREVLSRPRP